MMCRESPDIFVQVVFQVLLEVLLGFSKSRVNFPKAVGASRAHWCCPAGVGLCQIRAASSTCEVFSLFCLGTSARYQWLGEMGFHSKTAFSTGDGILPHDGAALCPSSVGFEPEKLQVWGDGVWKLAAFHTGLSVGHTSARGSRTTPGCGKAQTLWICTVSKGGYRLLCASKSGFEFAVTFHSVSFVWQHGVVCPLALLAI